MGTEGPAADVDTVGGGGGGCQAASLVGQVLLLVVAAVDVITPLLLGTRWLGSEGTR